MQSVALRPREARRKSPPALRTLVLNADYRPLSTYPLSIIAAHDAVSAIWRERVDVVEAWPDAFFRSPSTTIAVVPLPEPALAAVLRILSKPVDEPITNNAENLSVLHLLAYIAGAARSESISAAVVNRCLYAASKAQSSDDFATLFSISVEACGAYMQKSEQTGT
jgi:hypothetical protein